MFARNSKEASRCDPLATLTSVLVACAGLARADVFDTAPTNDNASGTTKNELIHGSDQTHDLAAIPGLPSPTPDVDWYRISQKPYALYEIVVDTASSAIGPTLALELIGSDGATVLASSAPVSTLGFSRSLRWHNGATLTPPTSPIDNQYIRVKSGQCTTGCTGDDVYRIRVLETTQFGPRFNNVGTLYTYYFLQNSTDYTIQTRVYSGAPREPSCARARSWTSRPAPWASSATTRSTSGGRGRRMSRSARTVATSRMNRATSRWSAMPVTGISAPKARHWIPWRPDGVRHRDADAAALKRRPLAKHRFLLNRRVQ